jgi:acetyl-CoA carboxylase biotin carboxyl carrier protein
LRECDELTASGEFADLEPGALADLLALLQASGVSELDLEIDDARLFIRRTTEVQPVVGPLVPLEVEPETIVVAAPAVGLFHRGPEEGAPPLVAEDEDVVAGQVLGIVEVLRMPHQVEAPRAGRVERFLVESGRPVEYGQPLVQLAASSRNLAEIETSPADPRRL